MWSGWVELSWWSLFCKCSWAAASLLCWKAGHAKKRFKLLQAELSRAHKPLCLTKDQKPGLRKLLGAELEAPRAGKVWLGVTLRWWLSRSRCDCHSFCTECRATASCRAYCRVQPFGIILIVDPKTCATARGKDISVSYSSVWQIFHWDYFLYCIWARISLAAFRWLANYLTSHKWNDWALTFGMVVERWSFFEVDLTM